MKHNVYNKIISHLRNIFAYKILLYYTQPELVTNFFYSVTCPLVYLYANPPNNYIMWYVEISQFRKR